MVLKLGPLHISYTILRNLNLQMIVIGRRRNNWIDLTKLIWVQRWSIVPRICVVAREPGSERTLSPQTKGESGIFATLYFSGSSIH